MSNTTDKQNPDLTHTQTTLEYGSPALKKVIEEIGKSATISKQEGNNPHPAIDIVRQSGLGAVRLPKAEGGAGYSLREFFSMFIDLAAADSDVPHILRSHYWFIEERLRSPNIEERSRWLKQVLKGDIFGNAVTEIGSSFGIATTLTPKADDFILQGKKYYCTGSLYSDWVAVAAIMPDRELATAVIPTNRAGVELVDDWDGIGQQFTGSGTGIFDQVTVHADELMSTQLVESRSSGKQIRVPTEPYLIAQFCQLILTAIIVGVMRNVVTDAVAMVKKRARTYAHGSAESAAADPLLLETIGRISSATTAAQAVVLAAADAQDEALATVVDGVADFEAAHRGSLLAAEAKVIIDEIAPRAATMLFDVGGSSAVKQSENLDRHWRNIRTLASHNPTVYKARAIGEFLVSGEHVPRNGFF
ncbi:MAG: acyl-CoA dehydrogenase [Pseudomonadales bacterium]|nr:acyl-CoA dehydrogenase [Pseudomonadales bacterium]